MTDPYQPPRTPLENPPTTPMATRFQEAVEWPPLRRARIFFILSGFFTLIFAGAILLSDQEGLRSGMETQWRADHDRKRPTTLERQQLEEQIDGKIQALRNGGWVGVILGLVVFLCGAFLFHRPALCSSVGFGVYTVAYVAVAIIDGNWVSGLGLIPRIVVSFLLGYATVVAVRFERDYADRAFKHSQNIGNR